MKLWPAILIFWIFISFPGFSQSFNFVNYSISDGLSQSVVNCVFQDSKGYIWLGTQNGLDRFDGRNFKLFRFNPADSNSISNNWIYAISEDLNGNLWIGTKGGLHKYDRNQNTFERIQYETGYDFDVTNYSYDNVCLSNGNILINTPPVISILNCDNQTFEHYISNFEYDASVKDVKVPVIEDRNGNIWIGSTLGLTMFSGKTKEFTYYSFKNNLGQSLMEINITALFEDISGKIWAGTNDGLYFFDSEAETFYEAEFLTEEGISHSINSCVRSILKDKKGNIFVATEGNGLFMITPIINEKYVIKNYLVNNSGIGHNIVQCLLIDNSNNLWAGTLSGISKTDLKPQKFKIYRNSNVPNSTNLLGNVIAGLFKNDDGIIWAGNWGQGLNLVNPESKEVEHFSSQHSGNHYLPNDFVHVIHKDNKNNIWLGTRNGIFIYDKAGNRFVLWTEYFKKPDFPTFENIRIYHIIQDKSENYWIASSNGLYRFNLDDESMVFFHTDAEPNHRLGANLIYSLLEDSEGLIWCATINGLDMYNPETHQIRHFTKENYGLNSNFLISLAEDDEGNIWIGSNAYVNILNKKTGEFDYMSQEDGFPSNYIYEIKIDKNNNLWFATGRGLCIYDTGTKKLRTFTHEDGLQSLEFNIRASFVCEDGEMLFGGMNGFNTFYPDSLAGNPHIPEMVLTSFKKTTGGIEESVHIEGVDKLTLNHKVQSITIEFAALEYTNSNYNHYAYKMEGISDDWVEIGSRMFVPFTGLQSGDYIFSVKGSNNDGLWNDEPVSLKVTILPPWYRSIYAYMAYLVLIIVTIILLIKQRERKLIRDKKILEQKVQERTIQIEEQNRMIVSKNQELEELNHTKDKLFSIIGHDLGNQFNIILGFLDVLVSNFKKLDQAKVETHLHNINNSSKQAYNLLENLLTWARMQTNLIQFNPEVFDIEEKVIDSVGLFEGACNKKKINLEIEKIETIKVLGDLNMFSTIFRNLVSNAIKFTSENGTISIFVERESDFCRISIRDNGIGISKENLEKIFKIGSKHRTRGTQGEKGTGLGLVLCKEFVEKQGGVLSVKSKVGEGSKFSFTLPIHKI